MTIHQIRFFMQSIKGGKWENKKGFHKKVHKRRQWRLSIIQARPSMRNGQLTSKHTFPTSTKLVTHTHQNEKLPLEVVTAGLGCT